MEDEHDEAAGRPMEHCSRPQPGGRAKSCGRVIATPASPEIKISSLAKGVADCTQGWGLHRSLRLDTHFWLTLGEQLGHGTIR